MGDWTEQLRRTAGATRVLALVEAPDAGLLCTENEVLFLNANGLQRAPLSEITKVSRDGPDLVLAGANQTFVRGSISVDKLTLANFFSEVKQAVAVARTKREVLLDTSVPTGNPTQSVAISSEALGEPSLGRSQAAPTFASVPPLPTMPQLETLPDRSVASLPRLSEAPRLSAAQDQVQFVPASFWWRALATIIDSVLLTVVAVALLFAFGGSSLLALITAADGGNSTTQLSSALLGLIGAYFLWLLVIIIGSWLYYTVLESSERQGTLGKMACGLFISNLDGERITFSQANGRYWSKIGVSIAIAIVFGIISLPFGSESAIGRLLNFASSLAVLYTYAMVFFTPRKQTLYDQISGTLVWKR
jgi:uncharacterized RDD family membrane protein YckC